MPTTLSTYTRSLEKIRKFKKENEKVFKELEKLEEEKDQIEQEFKAVVKEQGDMENDTVKATKVERYKKYYDYDLFLGNADEKEVNALMKAKGLKQEIKKDVFDECIEQGLISRETKQNCFKEDLTSVAVIIKEKNL